MWRGWSNTLVNVCRVTMHSQQSAHSIPHVCQGVVLEGYMLTHRFLFSYLEECAFGA